jgi:hypothetical protein
MLWPSIYGESPHRVKAGAFVAMPVQRFFGGK